MPKLSQKNKKIVTISRDKKRPKIEVQDLVLKKKYYRITGIKFKEERTKRYEKKKGKNISTDEFFITWSNPKDFDRGLSKLLRHYEYNRFDIKDIEGTTTHRRSSTTFIDKRFKE
jgi:hypothetical protein